MPVETLSTRELLPCHLGVHALPVGSNKSPGLIVFSEHALIITSSVWSMRASWCGAALSRVSPFVSGVQDYLHSTAHHRRVGLAESPMITPILYGPTVGTLFLLDDVSLLRVRFSEQVPLKKFNWLIDNLTASTEMVSTWI